MKEKLFAWLTGLAGFVVEVMFAWIRSPGAQMAAQMVPDALRYAREVSDMDAAALGLKPGADKSEIGSAKREWVYAKLREMAIVKGREIPSSVLNTAIEIAVQKLKS